VAAISITFKLTTIIIKLLLRRIRRMMFLLCVMILLQLVDSAGKCWASLAANHFAESWII